MLCIFYWLLRIFYDSSKWFMGDPEEQRSFPKIESNASQKLVKKLGFIYILSSANAHEYLTLVMLAPKYLSSILYVALTRRKRAILSRNVDMDSSGLFAVIYG